MTLTLPASVKDSTTNDETEPFTVGSALKDFHDAWDDAVARRPRQKHRSGQYRRSYARAVKLLTEQED